MDSVLIRNVEDLIDRWLQVREIAVDPFNQSKSDSVKHRSLDSERGTIWRDFMEKISGGEQRVMMIASHTDGFAPLRFRVRFRVRVRVRVSVRVRVRVSERVLCRTSTYRGK
jgi:hypothetical protein